MICEVVDNGAACTAEGSVWARVIDGSCFALTNTRTRIEGGGFMYTGPSLPTIRFILCDLHAAILDAETQGYRKGDP